MVQRIYERSDAEGRLAELMTRAKTGETVLIAEEGEVVARLVPARRKAATRRNETRGPVKISAGFEAADARLERMQAQGEVPRALRKIPRR
jgi:antitoxin (DNA-binding transcriptional repressor) of toxin-antitoxin stability system